MAKPRFYGKTTNTPGKARDMRWMKKNTRNRERAPRPLVAAQTTKEKEAKA